MLHTTTLNPDSWQTVKTLVDTCLDLPLAERGRYLAENCPDSAVRGEVLSLLEAYEESERFLDDPRAIAADVADLVDADTRDQFQIGPYKLIQEIGHGGMGTVYRAFRDDDSFQIVVGLKVVSRGMDSDAVLKRFRIERQILASLDHPYIARILDGGTTATGLPYFVMEYVDGKPLTKYCDEHKLGIPERLQLFRKVCEAVAYAHQSLVLHRDLKPGNILVTPDGTPKLLDFGIAKIVGGALEEDQDSTQTAFRMATPAYASPEQIRGGLTGVGSDVYSLGVLLYELLTGHPPYRLSSRDSEAVAQVICEREPTRASSVVDLSESIGFDGRQIQIDPIEIAKKRRTTVDTLRRRLRGDLDNIIAMALRKESQRRYASVEQLSEDIRRHLEGMPVSARPDTYLYCASKFVQRHRVGLAATVIAVIALCSTTTIAILKANRLANRVWLDQKLASLFLVDLHDSIAKLPGSTPAREVLLSQSLKYLNELAHDSSDDPVVHRSLALAHERFAELQSGAVAGGLGQASVAFETYKKAQKIREELVAAHPDDTSMQFELAESYLLAAVIVGRSGGASKRIEYDKKALTILERLNGAEPNNPKYHAALARAHTGTAYGVSFYQRWDEARAHFQKALALRKAILNASPHDSNARRSVSLIHYRLGVSYVQSGQPGAALQYLGDALALQTAIAEEDRQNRQLRSDMASTHHFLGVALGRINRPDEALAHLDAALAIRESMLAEDARDARTRSLLAGNYAEQSVVMLRVQKPQIAVAAAERALMLQMDVLKLDPTGVPVRVSAADFHSRAADAYIALAERTPEKKRQYQVKAAHLYARSAEFYDKLQAEGHVGNGPVLRDAAEARRQAANWRPMLSEGARVGSPI